MATACETLDALKKARLDLLTGSAVRRVRVQTGAVDKDVQFHAADLPTLDREIARYEGLCADEKGGAATPRRFAMRGG